MSDMDAEYGQIIEQTAPTVIIPAQPELVMAGVTGLLQPTVMKCAMGGWMVVIPGKGVASKSSLEEAIAFLEDYAFDYFKEPKTAPIPDFMRKPREEIIEDAVTSPGWSSVSKAVNVVVAAIVLFAGVKLAI